MSNQLFQSFVFLVNVAIICFTPLVMLLSVRLFLRTFNLPHDNDNIVAYRISSLNVFINCFCLIWYFVETSIQNKISLNNTVIESHSLQTITIQHSLFSEESFLFELSNRSILLPIYFRL